MGLLSELRKDRQIKRELNRAQKNNQIASLNAKTKAMETSIATVERFANSGYSHGGASRGETWAKHYHSESLSARSDIEMNRKTLRERCRDLAMNAPLATAAISSTRTSVVGPGLVPKPKIDYEFLGISQQEAEQLQKQIKNEFNLWAESTQCDNNDQNNFYALQQIAFNDWLKNGEEFCLIKQGEPKPNMPYQLRLKLIEADRVSTPNSFSAEYDGIDKKLPDGSRIMNGVEIDADGKVVAYHISSNYPGEYNEGISKWHRVEKRGRRTGNPNILHIFNAERAEQYRGVPFLAPVIQTIKQVSRYTEAEIMAAVINAMFAVFITTEEGDEIECFGGVDEEDLDAQAIGGAPNGEDQFKLGSGTINFLKNGEGVHPVESKHPSGNYDAFIKAMSMQIGAALEIAPEVLLKQFTNNFSSSKGALNESWKAFKMRRRWFVDDFCKEVYDLWFAEAVAKGRIHAPGFFTDPLIRKMYTNCTWTGPAQGCLNPAQEATAAVIRIENGLSTREDECAYINGSDYDDNVRTLKSENERLAEANRCLGSVESNSNIENMDNQDEDEEDEDAKKD